MLFCFVEAGRSLSLVEDCSREGEDRRGGKPLTCGDKAAARAEQERGRRALAQRQVRLRVRWGHWGVLPADFCFFVKWEVRSSAESKDAGGGLGRKV